jgi:arginyl-tRNA synthetase
MLTRKNDAVLDFDLKSVKEQSRDNPIFYVQYACARANSVIRNAQSEVSGIMNIVDLISNKALLRLNSEEELKLIKNMASWPRVVEAASVANEPHRIAFYLQELASDFHSLWNKGKDDAILRFIIKDDLELTAARIVLLKSMLNVFSSGLSVFNIKPVREM